MAFFERHGPEGLRVLSNLAIEAKQRELLVIMDAKRGDIGTTAQAYAEAWLGQTQYLQQMHDLKPLSGIRQSRAIYSPARRPCLVFYSGPNQ